MAKRVIKLIATFLYLGYFPIFPGTIGSLGSLGIYLLVKDNPLAYAISMLSLVILGFCVSGKAEEIFLKKDAKKIVIDDASGMLLTLFLIPFSITTLTLGFFIFRLIDILKPYPIRRLEHLPGSRGVMLDDLLAGIYANIILRLIQLTT